MKYFDDKHHQGVEVTPAEMGQKFLDSIGPGIKQFLYFNAYEIINFLKSHPDNPTT